MKIFIVTKRFFFPSFNGVRKFKETKLLPHSNELLYEVVSDVEKYKHFVPFCSDSKVIRNSIRIAFENEKKITKFNANLGIGFSGFDENFTSKVSCYEFSKVTAHCDENKLFHILKTTWEFSPSKDINHTAVSFEVEFHFKNFAYLQLSNVFFDKICNQMMNAFEARVKEIKKHQSKYRI